jgi:hypothetical protein
MRTYWRCGGCGAIGSVVHPLRADLWSVVEQLGVAHTKKRAEDCQWSYRDLRVSRRSFATRHRRQAGAR